MVQQFWDGLLDFVFPRNCLCCQRYIPHLKSRATSTEEFPNVLPFAPVCDSCLQTVEFNAPPFCLQCSRRLPNLSTGGICATCARHEIAFDEAWCACIFNTPMRQMIHAFKYRHKTVLRKTFSNLILNFLDQYKILLRDYHTLMPIPLHAARFRERGFNQAELIAQQLGISLEMPVKKNLIRTRPTSTQTQLSSKERFTNLRGAFRIMHPEDIQGKKILLIDDLLTTGATASEAAQALKIAGAQRVGVVTVAITS